MATSNSMLARLWSRRDALKVSPKRRKSKEQQVENEVSAEDDLDICDTAARLVRFRVEDHSERQQQSLALPVELRLLVYEAYFQDLFDPGKPIGDTPSTLRRRLPVYCIEVCLPFVTRIFCVCRQMHDEAAEYFWQMVAAHFYIIEAHTLAEMRSISMCLRTYTPLRMPQMTLRIAAPDWSSLSPSFRTGVDRIPTFTDEMRVALKILKRNGELAHTKNIPTPADIARRQLPWYQDSFKLCTERLDIFSSISELVVIGDLVKLDWSLETSEGPPVSRYLRKTLRSIRAALKRNVRVVPAGCNFDGA